MTNQQSQWLKRRQAIEPAIGKADHRMPVLLGRQPGRCDTVPCAAGYNLRWLLRAIVRGRMNRLFLGLLICSAAGASRRISDAVVIARAVDAGAGGGKLNFAGPTTYWWSIRDQATQY